MRARTPWKDDEDIAQIEGDLEGYIIWVGLDEIRAERNGNGIR